MLHIFHVQMFILLLQKEIHVLNLNMGEEAAKENFLYHDQSTCGKSYNFFYAELWERLLKIFQKNIWRHNLEKTKYRKQIKSLCNFSSSIIFYIQNLFVPF